MSLGNRALRTGRTAVAQWSWAGRGLVVGWSRAGHELVVG